jgi:hypothetical protein
MSYRFVDCFQAGSGCAIAECTVNNSYWWTEELFETRRVSFRNKFEKSVRLVCFTTKKFVTMHGHMSRCTVTCHDARSHDCKIRNDFLQCAIRTRRVLLSLGGNVQHVGMKLALKNSSQFNNHTYFIINSMFFILKQICNLFVAECGVRPFFDVKIVCLDRMWCDLDAPGVDWWWFQCYRRFFGSWHVCVCLPGVTVHLIVGLPVDFIKVRNRYQASATKLIRSALFWVITQGRVGWFRTDISGQLMTLGGGAYRLPQTSVGNYHKTVSNNPEQRRSKHNISCWLV